MRAQRTRRAGAAKDEEGVAAHGEAGRAPRLRDGPAASGLPGGPRCRHQVVGVHVVVPRICSVGARINRRHSLRSPVESSDIESLFYASSNHDRIFGTSCTAVPAPHPAWISESWLVQSQRQTTTDPKTIVPTAGERFVSHTPAPWPAKTTSNPLHVLKLCCARSEGGSPCAGFERSVHSSDPGSN